VETHAYISEENFPALVRILKVDVEEKKQRRLIMFILSIALVGGAWVGYDYYDTVSTELLPEDVMQMDGVIARWKRDGFVREFDVRAAVLIVDPDRWNDRKRVEKMNIVTQLARYCAEKNRTPAFLLRVQPAVDGPLLAEMGTRGLRVP
jgi:hypothetical protein